MGTQNTNHSFVHNSMKGMMLVILGASLWGVMGILSGDFRLRGIAAMILPFCDACWQGIWIFLF